MKKSSNFFDLITFTKYKSNEKKFRIGFFCESEHIFNYLEPYIEKKIKKKKIVIIYFEELTKNFQQGLSIFVFYNKELLAQIF